MAARVLLSWLRLCCLVHLLLCHGCYDGIRLINAEDTTEYLVDVEQGAEDSKLHMPQNVATNNFNDLHWIPRHLKEMNVIKRAPMGFTGVRGKKDMSDIWQSNINSLEERWKKTPSGFNGVRGKKYIDNDSELLPWQLNVQLKRQQQQQQLLEDLLERWSELALLEDGSSSGSLTKRAPVGFTGMRGKRYFYNDDNGKRALNNAFMGVRGKKSISNENDNNNDDHQFFKRSLLYDQKPDVIGSKRFADFANKFVAVRGKKVRNFINANERYLDNMWPQSLLLPAEDKRTPNGFMGMRGKRAIDINAKTVNHHG